MSFIIDILLLFFPFPLHWRIAQWRLCFLVPPPKQLSSPSGNPPTTTITTPPTKTPPSQPTLTATPPEPRRYVPPPSAQVAADVDQKTSARLSRPYKDHSPLWKAVGYSPLVSPSEIDSSSPITLWVPSASQQQTPSLTGYSPLSLPPLSPPGALNLRR